LPCPAVNHGIRGNPVLFDRSVFPEIMKISGDASARSVIEKNRHSLLEVTVEDAGVLVDVDTPSDCERASHRSIPGHK
jgi:molybdenum cofactor cytidylyltransferase